MKNLTKKPIIFLIASLILILLVVITLFIINKPAKTNKPIAEKNYTMYIKINPLVKLVFKEVTYACEEGDGVCTTLTGVTDYELINDDAKDIYNDLDLQDKNLYEVIGKLCQVARDNAIAFKAITITTDYQFDYEDFKDAMTNNQQYTVDYEINLDIEEELNEQEIKNAELENDPNIKSYTVTFDSVGGSAITKQVVKEFTPAKKPSDPTKNGYKFIEWQLNGQKFDFQQVITQDITLKAKWEKTTTLPTKDDNKEKPTTKKLQSTPDNINLNDNILVELPSHGINGSTFVISDNISTLLADFQSDYDAHVFEPAYMMSYCQGENESPECITKKNTFESQLKLITYNSEKAKKAKEEMVNYLNKQKGVINISITDDPKNFKYSFDNLTISYENIGLDEFKNAFNNKYAKIRRELDNIFYQNNGFIIEGGGAGGDGEVVLLDEKLCQEYNLNCSRW